MNEKHPQSKYVQHGRGLEVADCKFEKLCAAILGTTRGNSFHAFVDLIARCHPSNLHVANKHEDKNFFSGLQTYVLLYAVQLDLLFALTKKLIIPLPLGKPSTRRYDGFTQEDLTADDTFDDDSETLRAGDVEFCSPHDVANAQVLKE